MLIELGNANVDSDVVSVFHAIGNVCSRTDFELAIYRCVLVHLEGHTLRSGLLELTSGTRSARDGESKGIFSYGSDLAGNGLRLSSFLRVCRRRLGDGRWYRRNGRYECQYSQTGYGKQYDVRPLMHLNTPLVTFYSGGVNYYAEESPSEIGDRTSSLSGFEHWV
jgi:hypothetical protein